MTSVSDVYISDTADDPAVAAQRVLLERGDELQAELAAKVAAATDPQLSRADLGKAQDALIAFCGDRVRLQLAITDRALYAVAAGAAETRLLVRALHTHHQVLARHVADLERTNTPEQVAVSAHAVVAVLATCLEVERTTLLPALVALPGVDLPGLVEDITTLDSGGELAVPETLDVREIPHGRRHPTIFGLYARLAPGGSFVLVNNHDPKPLRREFEATYPGAFTWDYEVSGPQEWRVRIGRALEVE